MDEHLHSLLDGLRGLLSRYGYDERAEFLCSLSDESDSDALWATLGGLEFWGGSGAVWEVEPFHLTRPDTGAEADYRQFQSLMIELADLLESKGLAELAGRTAELFRRDVG
jgi:hypothetical protein